MLLKNPAKWEGRVGARSAPKSADWQIADRGAERGLRLRRQDLELAFALYFSAFTTQALTVDFDQTPGQIGTLTAEVLKLLLRRAVDAQRSSEAAVSTDSDAAH